ncbi:hypothetical protein [Cytobacillus firmus]|uniref:hypothetical protein n=1 Tax=Cytobacillus firmus TaxID=1399 RepID=UPI001C8E9567|nr:hypothetical protein [Cytobacillus firmus]MBX9972340.1 hypothetical protein [Cytobacillus firmus]
MSCMEKGYNSKEIHQHSQPDFKRIRQMADRPASSAKSSEAELSNLTLKKAYSALSKKMLLLIRKAEAPCEDNKPSLKT